MDTAIKAMPSGERTRFFALLGAQAFPSDDFSHEEVFGELANTAFTASEAAAYLEVSIATFRRYAQGGRITPCRRVGRNQFFATQDLRSFKHSLREARGR